MVKKLKTEKKEIKPKSELKENSKFKKRVKFTTKKLQIDKTILKKAILAIKQLNQELREKTLLEFDSNISLHIILKSKIEEEKVKNKILILPNPIGNDKKIVITHDRNKKNEETILKALEADKESFEPMSDEEFKTLLKSTKNKTNLGFIYHMFITEAKHTQKFKQMLSKDYHKLDFHYYNKPQEISRSLIESIRNSALLKNNDNKLFSIKLANTGLDNNEIYENIMKTLYKAVSYILISSQKHNTIKAIVLKSDTSIPFTIFGDMDSDDLVYFE